jgi:hypothetical protein
MYELFNVLERHGIVGPNDLLKVATLPAKKIEKLHHDLFNNDLRRTEREDLGQFLSRSRHILVSSQCVASRSFRLWLGRVRWK